MKDLISTRRSKRESRNLTAEERSKNINSMYENLDAIPPPDIVPIKQYEVYTTFCSIIPHELKY